ncbi:hypothetical protein B0T13DRAFT_444577 [Neurospora crassa]|nr:hypothetical protein B0T13DRAFT_444577 [Neurospora crassa]
MADRIGAPTPNLTERDGFTPRQNYQSGAVKLAKHRYKSLPNNRFLDKIRIIAQNRAPEIVVLLQAGAANATGLNSDLCLASHLVLGHIIRGTQILAISVCRKALRSPESTKK